MVDLFPTDFSHLFPNKKKRNKTGSRSRSRLDGDRSKKWQPNTKNTNEQVLGKRIKPWKFSILDLDLTVELAILDIEF